MNLALVAQAMGGYSVMQWLLIVIIVAAAIAITTIVLRKMGAAIPDWVVQIFWVLVAAFVGCAALYFLFSMVGRM